MRNWKIFLIHHTHTDIGYTDCQENICFEHYRFLMQAVEFSELGEEKHTGFRWQCENFWQIENFLGYAAEDEKQRLFRQIRNGRIGLSGSYLNLTELVDQETLLHACCRAREFAETIGTQLKSAMTADINGYAWGTADILSKAGIRNLFCALHTHHGMFPMYHNPSFFYWEGPEKNRVLTFIGEHYHWGNVLGFCPGGASSYFINDEFYRGMENGTLMRTDAETTRKQEMDLARKRITRYLQELEESGYPFEIVPIMVSGIYSDNGPPNIGIAKRVEELNEQFDGKITIRMSLLDDFFDVLEKQKEPIPILSGDFTDWWADGTGSEPDAVSLYRNAQRNLSVVRKMDRSYRENEAVTEAEKAMILFSEHTFNYSGSVSDPCDPLVNMIASAKRAYASRADSFARKALNQVLMTHGMKTLSSEGTQNYRIINPHDTEMSLPVHIPLYGWERLNGCIPDRNRMLALKNRLTGEILPCQSHRFSRGTMIESAITLPPGAEMDVEICYAPEKNIGLDHIPRFGADGVTDIADAPDSVLPTRIQTDDYVIRISREKGICSIVNRITGKELLDPDITCGLFGAAYDLTVPSGYSQVVTRRKMGRKRVSVNTQRSFSRLKSVLIADDGDVYTCIHLSYELPGTHFYTVDVFFYKHTPLIHGIVQMHKQSVSSTECMYVALPFITEGETWADKTGCIFRPGIDQLPGTCCEYWLLQNGLVREQRDRDILIACKDAPLTVLGLPEAEAVKLCSGQDCELNRKPVWSFIMNNFWETNFNAQLGGFHRFEYSILLCEPDSEAVQMKKCAALNEGFMVFRI